MYFKDDNNACSPLELPYMVQIRRHLSVIALWPGMTQIPTNPENIKTAGLRWSFKARSLVLLTILLTLLCSNALYVRNNINSVSFFDLGQSYITFFMYLLNVQCFITPWMKIYRVVMTEFIQEMHLFHFKNKSQYSKKIHDRVQLICSVLTYSVVFQLHVGQFFFNTAPVYNNYQHGLFTSNSTRVFKHSLDHFFPFNTETLLSYTILVIINYAISYISYISFCVYSLLLCLVMLHLYGHQKILNGSLRSIPGPRDGDVYTADEEIMFMNMFKENIDHHRMIVEFTGKTSKAFGLSVCMYYAFHLYTGCILLLECSTLDTATLGKYGSITVVIVQQLIQISFIFELVASQSEELTKAIYCVPWECARGGGARGAVRLMLARAQQPGGFKALGMVPVGVQTMVLILKTCFSYFIMLRKFATTE